MIQNVLALSGRGVGITSKNESIGRFRDACEVPTT